MSEKILLIDVDKCVGCYACEIACKQEHDLPLDPRWCRVVSIGPRTLQEKHHLDILPAMCFQCEEPVCSYFCSSGAIKKREDGLVIIDEDECTGCELCIYGCPYGAIYFNQEREIAGKCSFCTSRIDNGLEPSCVQHCIGGALMFMAEDEVGQITKGMHTARKGKVCYTSSKWNLQLG